MGVAAYNRGSRCISAQLDRELADRSMRRVPCGGKLYNGPDKRFGRCALCHRIDYEGYEGDRCRQTVLEQRLNAANVG